MEYTYETQGGVCSSYITFKLENGIISNICFIGGCNGNTQGIAKLADGMKATEIIEKLKNIKCGFKDSSCPDQLAIAVEKALAAKKDQSPERS